MGRSSNSPHRLTGLTFNPSLIGCSFGPDGKLYFSDQNNKKVVAFDPKSVQFVTRSVPAPNSAIAALAFGGDGNAYIMVSGSNAIQRMTKGKPGAGMIIVRYC
jgi:sugar lactone lactonase YvrE